MVKSLSTPLAPSDIELSTDSPGGANGATSSSGHDNGISSNGISVPAHANGSKPHDPSGRGDSASAAQPSGSGSSSGGEPQDKGDKGDEAAAALPSEHRVVQPHTVRPTPVLRSFLQRCKCWEAPEGFTTNKITTYKYTVLTFLPVNLFQQFMRVANLYFLFMTAIQAIPGLSPTSWFTTGFALIVVLTINAVKEGYDDYKRHMSDKEINAREVFVLRDGAETPTAWKDVMVGDIIKVVEGDEFPADLLFLASSDPEHICYVETANLDGETNLKNKTAVKDTAGSATAEHLAEWAEQHEIHCEQPNPRLYVFEGAIFTKSGAQDMVPVGPEQLLLRGCTLRNVEWVLGVAVFTGDDSKIMMNRTPHKRKVTQLEQHMNVVVITLFIVQASLAMLLAMGSMIWLSDHYKGDWYLMYQNKYPDYNPSFVAWILQAIRFIILINGLIPISLYVTLEITKFLQCAVIFNQDRRMYHRETDTPFACHTTSLNEDLGQVEYVMSDKTGTLTQNVMAFVQVSVAGVLYGKSLDGKGFEQASPAATPSPVGASAASPGGSAAAIPEDTPHSLTRDPRLHAAMSGSDGPEAARYLHDFFEHLAICSTVVPAVRAEGRVEYQASSPDEEALVKGASLLGYRLVGRRTDAVDIEANGQVRTYQLLAVLEFNSDRKRMSVIVRTPEGKIKLYCKGADSVILARLRPNDPAEEGTCADLSEMSQGGYRTLCVAMRDVSEEEFQKWAALHATAASALQDREEKIGAVAEKIECGMTLLGATALEDKLQDGVPEAIESLLRGGIRVWVLTGDKVETAISIAHSCRLFTEAMSIVLLREQDFHVDGVASEDEAFRTSVLQDKIKAVAAENAKVPGPDGDPCVGLVLEGGALALCLAPAFQDDLVSLCDSAKSVVCCRVTPMQKALVTRLVRKKKQAITLGIGDGANDVGMIQAAHIGVGIGGREGRAAVLASDFSFAQFRYLTRLLMWHGRMAFKGNVALIHYTIYKNWLYNMLFIWFAFVNGFSSQPLFTTGLLSTYNVLWTAFPIGAYAILEQDLSWKTIQSHPELYRQTMGCTRKHFLWRLLGWIALGTWQSLCIYFIPMYSMETPGPFGTSLDWAGIGLTIYTAVIITVNLKIAMRSRYFTWINHALLWGVSIGLYFAFAIGYNYVWQLWYFSGTANFSGETLRCWSTGQYWLGGVILAPAMALLPDITILCFQRTFAPKPQHILQEWEALGDRAKDSAFDAKARTSSMTKAPSVLATTN